MTQKLFKMFESGARLFGARHFSELLNITRATLLNYRNGRTERIPHEVVVKAMLLIQEAKLNGMKKMYNVKQTVRKKKK